MFSPNVLETYNQYALRPRSTSSICYIIFYFRAEFSFFFYLFTFLSYHTIHLHFSAVIRSSKVRTLNSASIIIYSFTNNFISRKLGYSL